MDKKRKRFGRILTRHGKGGILGILRLALGRYTPAGSLRKTEINSFYQTETLPEPCEVCPGFQFSIDWPRGPKAWDSWQIAQDWEVVGL